MEKIAKRHNMTFTEYRDFLQKDSSNYFKTEEDYLTFIRDWCKRADAALPQFFGKLPRCPYGVQPVPAYEAPSSAGAYYIGVSTEGAGRWREEGGGTGRGGGRGRERKEWEGEGEGEGEKMKGNGKPEISKILTWL
jgi:hypothetical protein